VQNGSPIARLRAIAARLLARDDPDGEWFACCLSEYQAGARHGRTLGDAFGLRLRPGESGWWELEARARRDDLIRRLAARFFSDLRRGAAATAIAGKVRRYESSRWRQHKAFTAPPAATSELGRALFELLKVGAPVTESVIARALRQQTPVFMPHASGDADADSATEETNASTCSEATG
jgi:hypothetical protein